MSARLYNFGLLYTDGEVTGAVNNLSGSARGIDIVFTDEFDDDEDEFITDSRGEFGDDGLTEGEYSAFIEDAGWSVPCMSGSTPDDDGPRDSDGTCSTPAPTTITGSLSGSKDFDDMGSLHVYDASLSASDYASGSVRVRGQSHGEGEHYDTSASWPTGWSRAADTEETENTTSIGTITWVSESVNFHFGSRNSALSAGAGAEVMKGSSECAGYTCTLDYHETGSDDEGQARENTLTVVVTAANGYDDHEYSLVVTRAAPVGNDMTAGDFLRVDDEDDETPATGGDGKSLTNAFIMNTENPTGSSLDMRIDLTMLGMAEEDNAYCAQSAMVQVYNDADTVESQNPEVEEGESDPYEDDVCRDTRYRLSVPELYEIEIMSEDSVTETYYLSTRNRDRGGAASLSSLEVEGESVPSFTPSDTTYSVVEVPEQVTVEWETTDDNASVRVTPSDADSQEDGHQFDLGDPNEEETLEIRVVSEDRKDTLHYVLDVRRANNVATLASLSADVDLNETFDAETTDYTADVAHDVATVTLTFAATDGNAETDPAGPSHTADLGAAGTDTDIEIEVTAEDGSTDETYTVTVTRAPASTPGIVLKRCATVVSGFDVAEGDTAKYTVELATEPSGDVTVEVTEDSDRLAVDVGTTLTFDAANPWNTPQNVEISTTSDADAEDEDPVMITHTAASSDTDYEGETAMAAVQLTETDSKGFMLSATGKEVSEGAEVTYTIAPTSQPSGGNITVEVTGAPAGVTVTPSQVVFTDADWDAEEITINTADAADEDDANQAFTLGHNALGGGYTGIAIDDVDATIMDIGAAQVVITTTAVTVNEGGMFTYNIALTQEPGLGETVTVDLGFNTSDFGASATTAAFTNGDWDAVEITITAKNVNADATKSISHSVSVADTDDSDDQVYADGTTASTTTVTVMNVPN